MSIRNAQDGVGLIQTAEAGLNEIRNMVLRMRELAVQMANGIYEDTPDRDNAQLEVAALLAQVDLIAENTKFNNVAVIDGSFTSVNIQAGNSTAETIELSFVDLGQTGIAINGANVGTQASALVVMGTMDTALQTIASEQAKFGSLINRLNFSIANLSKASPHNTGRTSTRLALKNGLTSAGVHISAIQGVTRPWAHPVAHSASTRGPSG